MKNLALLAGILSVLALGQGDPGADCKACQEAVGKLGRHLVKPEEIEKEKLLFKSKLCVADQNVTDCSANVDELWPKIAEAIFNFPSTPTDICNGSPTICKINNLSCPDQTTCTNLLSEIAKIFSDPSFIKSSMERLTGNGSDLCNWNGLDQETRKKSCMEFVQRHWPRAVPLVGMALIAGAGGLCPVFRMPIPGAPPCPAK